MLTVMKDFLLLVKINQNDELQVRKKKFIDGKSAKSFTHMQVWIKENHIEIINVVKSTVWHPNEHG